MALPESQNIEDRRGRPSTMLDIYVDQKAKVDELWRKYPNLEQRIRDWRRVNSGELPSVTHDPLAVALGYNDIGRRE